MNDSLPSTGVVGGYSARRERWLVLGCFGAAAGLSQLLWLNFAPLLSLIEKIHGVSEAVAGLLLLVFPLISVLLSVHAGALTDRQGYRRSLVFGTAVMAVFSCVRIVPGSFWLLLAAQIGIAVAQPYVVNAISKLVLDWFPKEEEALATGLGTMGMFVGMAGGLALTPLSVDAWGLQGAMTFFAGLSVLIFLATLRWVRANPRPWITDESGTARISEKSFLAEVKSLLADPQLVRVFLLSFLGLGFFNGLTTWLEPILAPRGLDSAQAGFIGGALIGGGILGSVIVPALSDRLRRRRPLLVACILGGCALLYPLTWSSHLGTGLFLGAAEGFFFLPAFALLLEMCSELAGPLRAGFATGILMLAGNAGAVVVILAMEWIKGESPTFERAILLLLFLLLLAVVLASRLKETYRKN